MKFLNRKKAKDSTLPKEVTASPFYDSRVSFQNVVDYWETRILLGDFLLDQYMHDALAAAREGLVALDKLQKAGYITGKKYVKSGVPTVPDKIEVTVDKAYEQRADNDDELSVTYKIYVGKSSMITGMVLQKFTPLDDNDFSASVKKQVMSRVSKSFSGNLSQVPYSFET